MATTKITAKGQVTIPKEVRDRMGLNVGDELEFIEEHDGFHIRKHFGPNPLKKWRGYLTELAGADPDELVREMRDP